MLSPGAGNPLVMGVVNVTPDSFSDGGRYFETDAAVAHGRALEQEGAAIIDVGGESTRPGADPVDEAEELARVIPVIEQVARGGAAVSVDTRKRAVAEAALAAGARIVNDVTAFRDAPEIASLVASSGAWCILMHMRGEPRTMQRDPRYDDVVGEVASFLEARLRFAVDEGVAEERIWLDPGIGFGKTLEHNLELLRRLHELTELGRPIVVGTSRKSFLGHLAGRARGLAEPLGSDERLPGTIASNVLALERGASVFRVHDVAAVRDALAVAAATLGATWKARSTAKSPTS
jgi:dihydropteroate synthase